MSLPLTASRFARNLALVALALSAAPGTVFAQSVPSSASVACTPGIPGCTSLRFTVASPSQFSMNSLFLSMAGGSFAFAQPFGPGNPGTYSAMDAIGAFGGSTTIYPGATSLFIDFLGENGFAFEWASDGSTWLDFDALNPAGSDASALAFSYEATGTSNGVDVQISSTPEPVTLALMATGLASVAAARRRRRQTRGVVEGAV